MGRIGRIRAIIRIEWIKLRAKRSTYILPLITAGFVLLIGYGYRLGVTTRFIGIESGYYLASTTINTAFYLLTILAVVMVASMVGNEFVTGTIRYILSRPIKREEWLIGNLISLASLLTILYLTIVLCGIFLGAMTYGYAPLVEKGFVIHSQGELMNRFTLALSLPLLPFFTLIIAVELITLITENPGTAIGIALGGGFALSLLSNQVNWGRLFWANYIFSPLSEMEKMAKGLPTDWPSIISWSVGSSLSTGLLLLSVCIWIIRRKEILA